MILADSSIWIDHFRGKMTRGTAALRAAARARDLLLGDLVKLEILLGVRDEEHAQQICEELSVFPAVALLDPQLAAAAARNYRILRGIGITARKTAALIIGTYCIERGHKLLHADRDFEPMQRHLGLLAV